MAATYRAFRRAQERDPDGLWLAVWTPLLNTLRRRALTGGAASVVLAIALRTHLRHVRGEWIGAGDLMADTGMSESAVRKALQELAWAGLLVTMNEDSEWWIHKSDKREWMGFRAWREIRCDAYHESGSPLDSAPFQGLQWLADHGGFVRVPAVVVRLAIRLGLTRKQWAVLAVIAGSLHRADWQATALSTPRSGRPSGSTRRRRGRSSSGSPRPG